MATKASAKPAHRLEVKYHSSKWRDLQGWIGVRYEGGHGCEIITLDSKKQVRVFDNPITAAWESLIADDKLPLWVPQHIKDGLEVMFDIKSEGWGVQVAPQGA